MATRSHAAIVTTATPRNLKPEAPRLTKGLKAA
jgi:hypothetical protein